MPPIPTDPVHAAPEPPQLVEARGAKRLFAFGSLLAMAVWAVEMHQGVITPWDRWLLPLMAAFFVVAALWLHVWPQRSLWPKVLGCIGFNAYLVLSTLLVIFIDAGPHRQYQLLTGFYWQPLGYAVAFLFLSTRAALAVSVAVYAAMFVPLGLRVVGGSAFSAPLAPLAPSAPSFGPEFNSLIGVIAAAQVAYIVLLLAVATIRAGYLRASERLRVTEHLVNTDMLTGLKSRRACESLLRRALEQARSDGTAVALMLLDIDHFKRINDAHGHATGDRVLVDVGRVLGAELRATDHLGRWGGEEFLVMALGSTAHAGQQLGERLRAAVAAFPFEHGEQVTVSIGLTQYLPGDDVDALLARADRALYRAKDSGRNRLVTERLAQANGAPSGK